MELRKPLSITNYQAQVNAWDGEPPTPEVWHLARQKAKQAAEKQVGLMRRLAQKREGKAVTRQLQAAQMRLTKELGRFLMCLGGTGELNAVFSQQMSQKTPTAVRLRHCFEQLGGRYPDWTQDMRYELENFFQQIKENQRQARLLGREVDAALKDPRWRAWKSGA